MAAVAKNPLQIRRNEKFLHEPAARHGVVDAITDEIRAFAILRVFRRVFGLPACC